MKGELSYRGFTIVEQASEKQLNDIEFVAEGPDDGEGPLHIACLSLTDLLAGIDELLAATDGATTAQAVVDRTPKWMKAWIAEGCAGRLLVPSSNIAGLFGYTSKGLRRVSGAVQPLAKPLTMACCFVSFWALLSDCDAPGLISLGITASGLL